MKKSLIALAALAAFGTASAQSSVTISGKFAGSYNANTSNTGAKSSGVVVSDGDLNFAAVEDLGGGLKADVAIALRTRGREASGDGASDGVGGRNAHVRLTGGFGSVMIGAVSSPSSIAALGSAGAVGFKGLDDGGELLDAETNGIDLLQYTTPTMMGVSGYVQFVDSIGDPTSYGREAAATTPAATVFGANYANGPIQANIDTTSFKCNATTSCVLDSRVRASASYNLGVARVGFGYQTNNNTTTDVKQMIAGLNVPVNAQLSAAFNYATRDTKTISTGATVTNKGWEAGANYSLSKRTAVAVSYRLINEGAYAIDQKHTRVRLMHSF
jgi:predicted porin